MKIDKTKNYWLITLVVSLLSQLFAWIAYTKIELITSNSSNYVMLFLTTFFIVVVTGVVPVLIYEKYICKSEKDYNE